MSFGLANALPIFPAVLNNIFWDLLDNRVVVYIEDILIYFKTEEQYCRLVKEVLQCILKHALATALEK